jgi:hypothetical protein
MLRLLALLLLALLLWIVLEGALQIARRLAGAALRKAAMPPRQAPPAVAGEELVRCVVCGTHVPRSRALAAPGAPADLYCSDSCRRSSPLAS